MSRVVPRVPGESATEAAPAAAEVVADEPEQEAAPIAQAVFRQPLQIDTSEPLRPLPAPENPLDYDIAMAGLLDGSLHVPIYTTRGYLVDQPLIEKAA